MAFSRTLTRRRVLVNLRSGTVFTGILWARRGPLLVLRAVEVRAPTANARFVPVDGEIVVERPQVDYIQVLPHGQVG